MTDSLNRLEAIDFLRERLPALALSASQFDNLNKFARELPGVKISNKWTFEVDALEEWAQEHEERHVHLSHDDYMQAFDFGLAKHFSGWTSADFGTATQRDFGKKVNDWTRGLLGELALRRWLETLFAESHDLSIRLNFDLAEQSVAMDIDSIKVGDRTVDPRVRVSVKTTKPNGSYLIVGRNQVEIQENRCDAYVLCRVHLPDDHLLRLTRDNVRAALEEAARGKNLALHYDSYRDKMPAWEQIRAEVSGWCSYDQLVAGGPVNTLKPIGNLKETSYAVPSGMLRRSRPDWEVFLDELLGDS